MLVGAGVRCITSSVPAATWLANIAAILNGLGAPIFIGGAPVISAIWFPASERITATSSGIAFAYGGIAFAFLLGPFVVNYNPETFPGAIISENTTSFNTTTVPTEPSALSANFSQAFIDNQRHNIMNLMYIEFGWIGFLFLVTMVYFPDKPPKPPSISATQGRTNCYEGLKTLLSDFHFWMVLVPFALTQGFFFGWGSALELNLHPIGVTQYEAGWVGFASSIAGIAGTLTIGRIADAFSHHLKIIVIVFLAVAVIFCAWMTVIIDSLVAMNFAALLIATVVSATATQATCPLFYEMACESSYPVSESVIGGVLTMAGNVINVLFLLVFLIPNIGTKWLNYGLIGALVGSTVFICFYQQKFRRLAIDQPGEGEVDGYDALDEGKDTTENEGVNEENEAKKTGS
ncbi:solute carrier family 49 member 4 homolog isoform X2 [Lineus longissimus]